VGGPIKNSLIHEEGERRMKKILFLLSVIMLLLAMGCTHNLRITNEEANKPLQVRPAKAVKIGFVYSEDALINSVIEEMSLNPMVKEAKKGYQIGSAVEVDYVSELTNTMNYSASGQNFLITIPGFLIFTHAWLGYKYYVDIDTQSKLLDAKGNVLSEQKITTPYEFRFTSFPRGAAASCIGWLTPGWGIIDIIPGIIFATSYDDRANPELIDKVKPSYKSYVSSKLLEQIAAVQNNASSAQKISNKKETIVVDDEPSKNMTPRD
jgi:hypothetical protein